MDEVLKKCFEKWARIEKPNSNLSEAYVKMSREDLVVLRSLPDIAKTWKAVAAYYARYHIITALILRIGVDCKDHNCSINIAEYLFPDIDKKLFSDLRKAKRQRINLQYYIDRPVSEKDIQKNLENVDFFIGSVSKTLEGLTREKIENIRRKLK